MFFWVIPLEPMKLDIGKWNYPYTTKYNTQTVCINLENLPSLSIGSPVNISFVLHHLIEDIW